MTTAAPPRREAAEDARPAAGRGSRSRSSAAPSTLTQRSSGSTSSANGRTGAGPVAVAHGRKRRALGRRQRGQSGRQGREGCDLRIARASARLSRQAAFASRPPSAQPAACDRKEPPVSPHPKCGGPHGRVADGRRRPGARLARRPVSRVLCPSFVHACSHSRVQGGARPSPYCGRRVDPALASPPPHRTPRAALHPRKELCTRDLEDLIGQKKVRVTKSGLMPSTQRGPWSREARLAAPRARQGANATAPPGCGPFSLRPPRA